jgi:hypothetical protein
MAVRARGGSFAKTLIDIEEGMVRTLTELLNALPQ